MTKSTTGRIAAMLVLAALLCVEVQAAVAEENMLTISVGKEIEENRTDPTIYAKMQPGIGGPQEYHYYTHFSPLITLDSNLNIVPWMAESYEVSDDFATIIFHLRKGVRFADGTPLNARILKFNFDRILTYGLKDFGITSRMLMFVNYDYSEALNEYTFKVHFTEGWLDMPFDFASVSMFGRFISPLDVSPAWDIKGALKPEKKYDGLGAYYVDENESIPKQKVVLKRRHSWQDDLNFHKPILNKIVLTYIADPMTAVMALDKGDIDYICRYWNAPLDALPELEKNPDVSIKTSPESRIYFLKSAFWKEPFNSTDGILLRKAICYALNRGEMVDGVFNGYAQPATDATYLSPQRPDVPKCCGKGYDYDINKAKQLLAEAGWKDTNGDGIIDKNGAALKIDLVCTSSSDLIWQKDLALVVQSQLKKIGIDIDVQILEWSEYLIALQDGKYDLMMGYTIGNGISLSQQLTALNQTRYKNPYTNQNRTLQTIVEEARTVINKEERDNYICQICNDLYEEAGVIPLVYEMQYAVMSIKVKGFELGPSMNYYYLDHAEECYIED